MLVYSAGNTRPDIAFSALQTARFIPSPCDVNMNRVRKLIHYLIFFRSTNFYEDTKSEKSGVTNEEAQR
jgi:hypothetical protein